MASVMKNSRDEQRGSVAPDSLGGFGMLEKSAMGFYRAFAENLRVDGDGAFECSLPAELLMAAFRYESFFRGFKAEHEERHELLPQASPLMRMAREINLAYECLFRPCEDSEQALIYRDILDVFREAMGTPVLVRFAPNINTSNGAATVHIRGVATPDEFAPDYRE